MIAALTFASVIVGVGGAHAGSLPLQWDAPTTNADGTPLSDLASYRIYLGTTTPTCPSASFHTITAPATTPGVGEIVASRIVGLVAGTTYFARVTAVDAAGNESGCSGSASGAAVAELSVAPGAATSFGSAMVGTTVDRTFTVQNTSTASLSGSVSVGAPYTVTSGGSFTLAPGATRTVTVQFAPTAPGSFAGNVNFTTGGDVVSRSVNGSATASAVTLNVTRAGTGAGTVTSAPAGIACGADCSESVAPGTQLTLTASATTGSTFTGWSGACSGTGTCTVTMSAARTVTATFTLAPVTLSVTKSGTGAGTVTSAPAGITCGADCSESVAPGTQLTLTASATTGSTFTGWSGACSGTGTCTVTVNAATTVSARFDLVPMTLSLTRNGSGTGTVTSAPAGIACGTDCSETVTPGTQLTLTASAATGSTFAGWSGACSGAGTCTVTVNTATSVTATFNLVPVTLSVARSGSGSGTVTSAPAGIACGADCSEAVAPGTQLTLTATAASGSTFAGWSGGCSGTGQCTVTVNAAASVTATFILAPVTLSVTKGGTGSGTVTSLPAGIACGTDCSETVPPGTSLTLSATPDAGAVFSGWTGACSGTGACTVTMSAARAVTATFEPARVDRPLQPSPAPIVRDLSPSWATAGTTGLTLTVEGRGFVAASVVQWNGAPRTTSFIDSRRLRAVITADDLASARMAAVSVLTPAPGGGLSQSARFMVAPSFRTPTPPSTPVSPILPTGRDGDFVIDNAEPGVQDATRSYTGSWCRAQTSARFGASSLLACGTGIDAYRWTPQIPASGTYEVYVWVAGSRELSGSVPFVVAHAGGSTVRTLDQQNGRGRWVLHGRYVFQAGTDGYVEARSNPAQTEGGPAGADAVRFVRRR